MLSACLVVIGPVDLERKILQCELLMFFLYFAIISPWKGILPVPFIQTNLIIRMLCAKFGLKFNASLEDEMGKSLRYNNDRHNAQRLTNFDQKVNLRLWHR